MCLYVCFEAVVNIQAMLLQEEWEKVAILSLVYKSMRHRERSIWSQERVTYNTFKFLFERLSPYLKKEET